MTIESVEKQQASNENVSSDASLEIKKTQIKEQRDIKGKVMPTSSRVLYILIIGACLGVLVLLGLRKLF